MLSIKFELIIINASFRGFNILSDIFALDFNDDISILNKRDGITSIAEQSVIIGFR